MTRIAVIGLGAVGSVVAAHLEAADRHEVIGCVRGAAVAPQVEPAGGRRVAVRRVIREAEQAPPCAWTLLATKAQHARGAAPWMVRTLGGEGRLAVLQNGVEHRERLAGLVPPQRILPVVVECPSTRVSDELVRQRGAARLTVPDSPAGTDFAALFDGTDVAVVLTDDFLSAAWRKLALNVAGGAITALTGCGVGVVRRPAIAAFARELAAECVAVGRAEGAILEEGLVAEVLQRLQAANPEAPTSLSTDRSRGRSLEHDARHGAVVRGGLRHDIPTPANALADALLAAVSDRLQTRSDEA